MPERRRRRIRLSKLYSFSCFRSSFQENHAQIGQKGYSRVVYCNDPENVEAAQLRYRGNYVSTAKYSAVNFIPKSLFEQFRRVANIYFLVVSFVSFSPLAPYTAVSVLAPLIVVIGATMVKEAVEDWRRRKQDIEANNRKVEVFRNGSFHETRWKKLRVGDVVKVNKDEYFPADLLLLSSGYEDGVCYVETMNLDGETNLKLNQIQTPARMQHQNQPAMPSSSMAAPAVNVHSQSMPSHPLQPPQQSKGHLNSQVNPASLPQSSQLPNIPSLPLYSSSQPPPLHQPQMPTSSSQLQQPLQTTGIHHLQQPPLPSQPRQPSMGFQHQYTPQMGPNMGFQHPGAPQHHPQPMFHAGNKPPASMGPSFSHGQMPIPNQQPPQSMYQPGGMRIGSEFNNQAASSMQVDRGSSWMSTPPENPTLSQLSGPTQLVPGQMGPGNQSSRPSSLTPEMEKALLQQVMSLTPEQINLLPPEQRNQVLQLQQILRQ